MPRVPRTPSRGWRWLRRIVLALLALWLVVTAVAFGYLELTSPPPRIAVAGQYVRTGDVTTRYLSWGPANGRPVVLVPGFMETAGVWQQVGERLGAAGLHTVAYDVRGFGWTSRNGPYDLPSDTTQLAELIKALHLRHPMLVGHSSGAAIVGDLALTRPGLARRIVFVDGDGTPYGVGPGWIHALVVDPYAGAMIRLVERHPGLARSVYRRACGTGCPPFDERLWLGWLGEPGAERSLRQILAKPLIGLTYAQEARIRVPADVLFGQLDSQMGRSQAQDTGRRIRASQVLEVPHASHLVMMSHPGQVAAVLSRWARSS